MGKIGLITFTTTLDNYGQVLQALAIKDYLQNRGHDVFLMREKEGLATSVSLFIRYLIKKLIYFFTKSSKIKKSIETQKNLVHWRAVYKANEKLHPRFFENFRKENFVIIDCNNKAIKKYRLSALCAGSDQIWGSHDKIHFLQIGTSSLKRFSIGPSTGDRQLTQVGKNLVSQWLKSFSFVTVREPSGVVMCRECGYENVSLVPDPTFLLSMTQYNRYTTQGDNCGDYIFVYLLRSQSPVSLDEIDVFAKRHNLKVKYVSGQGRMDEHTKIYATVPEWLSLIRNARYIITNSFHGMAFSIIYQKQFLVLPRVDETKNMNERIFSLTNILCLEDRIYNGHLDILFESINYKKAEAKIIENKQVVDNLMSKISM